MEEIESTSPAQEDLTDQQMDDLVSRSEKPSNRDIPMTREDPKAQPEKDPVDNDLNFEFKHNGKTVKATREQMLKWAQQGYNYPQLLQKFNQEKSTWEKTRQQAEAQYGQYQQIDQWAKQNPQAWQQLQHLYQQLQTGQITQGQYNQQTQAVQNQAQAQNPQSFAQLDPQIAQKFNEVSEFVQSEKEKAEDRELDQEIQSIRAKHKDLDWESLDENGKSLEARVLEHATELGTKKFSVAFKDLLHDELLARAQAQAKQQVSKGIQQKTRLGLLSESSTPKKPGFSQAKDPKKQTYEELAREAIEELKAGA